MEELITKTFGNKLRVRVSGILVENNKVLLIKHHNLGEDYLWSPPGGGLDFGESLLKCLQREFLEETGLEVEITNFLGVNEFLQIPLHAIELFFEVRTVGGELAQGKDPEMLDNEQIIQSIAFLSIAEINQEKSKNLHKLFHHISSLDSILSRKSHIELQ